MHMKSASGFVYFVQMGENGPVKVGWAGSLAAVGRRVDAMQTGCPSPLLLRGVSIGSRARERELHILLDGARLRGEWFAWCDEIEAIVSTADAGDGVVVRHRRGDFQNRMPIEAASLLWRDVSLSTEAALARMTGWTITTAKRVFGPRHLNVPYAMDTETARKVGAKGGAVLKSRAVTTRWKSPGMKAEFDRWAAVWRDSQYANDQEAADAIDVPELHGRPYICRRIFGPRRPGDRRAGGRPRAKSR